MVVVGNIGGHTIVEKNPETVRLVFFFSAADP